MLDKMPPKCEENLYRKQYGNLKECVLAGKAIMAFFKLDGTAFKFHKWDKLVALNQTGVIEPAAWEKACEGRTAYLTKWLTMCKQNNMNICKLCDMRFHNGAAHINCGANNMGPHNAKYDFTIDENVLNCEIK